MCSNTKSKKISKGEKTIFQCQFFLVTLSNMACVCKAGHRYLHR